MHAMVFTSPGRPLAITETVAPQPNEQQVLIRVGACAVCEPICISSMASSRTRSCPLSPAMRSWAW